MDMDVLGRCPALRRRPHQYWPRRLLHIPTMTSYEKQAGNKYGLHNPVTEPPYATLSYTWARYLRRKSSSASGVRISGIDWDTPKIDPDHFTARGLLQAINTIHEISQLDYLWIDIACINIERIPDDDLDPEISMQQDIFFDATAPFIWLSRTDHSCLLHLGKAFADISLLNDAKTIPALLQVMADPWFSSLWTLLEAAVRTDAVILSSECRATTTRRQNSGQILTDELESIRFTSETGETATFELKGSKPSLMRRDNTQYATISQYLTLQDLTRLVRRVMRSVSLGDARVAFREAANKSGLLSFEPFNLLSLYGSAQHRHEMKPGLRMKYIYNQLFGFDGLRTGDTLPQIEDQFNSQLIQRCPVLSQLFVRQTPLQKGSAWLLTTGCTIPDIQLFVAYASSYVCLFTLNVDTSLRIGSKDKMSTIHFHGPTSDFKTMASQWLDNGTYPSHRLLGISFDQCIVSRRDGSKVEVATSMVSPTLSPGGYTLSLRSQRECIGNFLRSLGDLEAKVLAMAAGSGILPGCRIGIGLIIVPQHRGASDQAWHRVGICFWAFEESGSDQEQFVGTAGLNMPEVVWDVTEGCSAD